MLNRILFAVAPMILVASSVVAEDNLLSRIANMELSDSVAAVDDRDDLGQADVESLLNEGEESSGEEAIAACFRRIGYGYRHSGYRSYHSYYRPCYNTSYSYGYNFSSSYYPRYHSYAPCYSHYTPVYTSYWGCW
ncbi:hypothetical protein [Novipirellula artificiosorum]|uniref:Uncharacterized protein n=1 Tax=Novipirellula artificiosorum TaxID=2528016 RepID=A0A5C6DNA0_9BACT|nr:hypothetical protein [Novipirellula artificiosorum]TWU38320.1 hypothetical protein Poly41_27960 [Novipirellula artificiosorum]